MLWWQHFGPTFYRILCKTNDISLLVNEYLSSIIQFIGEEIFQPKTCTHRLLLCSTTLALPDGGTFFLFLIENYLPFTRL